MLYILFVINFVNCRKSIKKGQRKSHNEYIPRLFGLVYKIPGVGEFRTLKERNTPPYPSLKPYTYWLLIQYHFKLIVHYSHANYFVQLTGLFLVKKNPNNNKSAHKICIL